MTSLRSPEASARTRSDERSVLPRHTSPCTRGARQGLDRLRPRCGLCPIRLRRSRHARERCCGSAAPIASLSCLPARSPRPGGRWALHRGCAVSAASAAPEDPPRDRDAGSFVSVAGFAGNAPDAPAQTQQAKDHVHAGLSFIHARSPKVSRVQRSGRPQSPRLPHFGARRAAHRVFRRATTTRRSTVSSMTTSAPATYACRCGGMMVERMCDEEHPRRGAQNPCPPKDNRTALRFQPYTRTEPRRPRQ